MGFLHEVCHSPPNAAAQLGGLAGLGLGPRAVAPTSPTPSVSGPRAYFVPLLCIVAVGEAGLVLGVLDDFPLLQVKLPLSFKVKPVLLVF